MSAASHRRHPEGSDDSCHARIGAMVVPCAGRPSRLLECIHDARLVRAPQIQICSAGDGDSGELGHRLCAVPANRIGSAVYSPAELKTIQEVITLIVFAGFTAVYFKEPLSLTQGAGFALIALGAMLVFRGQA